ncbi:MAG: minor capsid protein [Clostridium sp.]
MKNKDYWIEREKEKLKFQDHVIEQQMEKIRSVIEDSINQIEEDIYKIYSQYAVDNKMSYQESLNYLTNGEVKELKKTLKWYIDTYKNKEKAKLYRNELQALSTKARIRRLEGLKANIRIQALKLEEILLDKQIDYYELTYRDGLLNSVFNIINSTGIEVRYDLPGNEVTKKLLEYPWSGKNYSDKVWNITDNFVNKMDSILTTGLIQGKSSKSIASELHKAGLGKNGKLYECQRLVRTESAFIAESATMDMYNKSNIEEYEFLATLDLRTSDICSSLDGKIFKREEAKIGINYPPIHPWCRSTTVPVIKFEGEDNADTERMARDPNTGRSYYTKVNNYTEWRSEVISKYGEDSIEILRKKIINKTSDKKQHKRYKEVLGEGVTNNFDEFQEIKYNSNRWNELKRGYTLYNKSSMQVRLDYIQDMQKSFIPTKAKITNVKIIAGNGSNTLLRSSQMLSDNFGGIPEEWSKKTGRIESDKYIFDVHWNELDGKQYIMKLKHRKEKRL